MFRPKEIVRLVPEPIMFKHDFFVTMKQRIMPVLHLTSSLAQKYDEKSREAFIGDGTCSLQNMELSCFASESCNQNRRNLTFQLKNLMNEDLSLIYVHNDTFLGCLSAHRTDASSALQILFPYLNPESGSVLVSNLCVSSASRGEGVCKKLMEEILRHFNTIYVLVQREMTRDLHVNKFMKNRSQNLLIVYEKLNFRLIHTSMNYFLLIRR